DDEALENFKADQAVFWHAFCGGQRLQRIDSEKLIRQSRVAHLQALQFHQPDVLRLLANTPALQRSLRFQAQLARDGWGHNIGAARVTKNAERPFAVQLDLQVDVIVKELERNRRGSLAAR